MLYKKREHYNKLNIDFNIPDFLEEEINVFVDYLNNSDGLSEDCYREEISLMIRDSELSDDRKKLLKDYYVWGGIYNDQ